MKKITAILLMALMVLSLTDVVTRQVRIIMVQREVQNQQA